VKDNTTAKEQTAVCMTLWGIARHTSDCPPGSKLSIQRMAP